MFNKIKNKYYSWQIAKNEKMLEKICDDITSNINEGLGFECEKKRAEERAKKARNNVDLDELKLKS